MATLEHDADLDAILARDAVTPGSGAARVAQVGRELWTDTDQAELNRLLTEGQGVYVPPDVDDTDLPAPRSKNYSYVVSTEGDVSSPGVSDRIAMWNKVVSTNDGSNISSDTMVQNTAAQISPLHSTIAGVGSDKSTTQDNHMVTGTTESYPLPDTNSAQREYVPGITTATGDRNKDESPSFVPVSQVQQQQHEQVAARNHEQQQERIQRHQQIVHSTTTTTTTTTPILANADADAVPSPSDLTTPTTTPAAAPTQTQSVVVVRDLSAADVDVSRTIFGGNFLTVPVVSHTTPTTPTTTMQDDHLTITTQPPQRPPHQQQQVSTQGTDLMPIHDGAATARVNVSADFGLKGGHGVGTVVHDATFVHNGSKLVTCGSDGRVCIWAMSDRNVQYEFTPYDGSEAVIMVYPLDSEDDDEENEDNSYTLITLSQSRVLRIWLVDATQAIMLRNSTIGDSETDLYMTITPISKALKKKAIAAAAAALITTSPDRPVEAQPVALGTAAHEQEDEVEEQEEQEEQEEDVHGQDELQIIGGEPVVKEIEQINIEDVVEDEEDAGKRFSLSKVLSFNRSGSKKAVPI